MKKSVLIFCLLFSLIGPLKFALSYVVSFGTCAVDYGTEWLSLTGRTAKCAWTHATLGA